MNDSGRKYFRIIVGIVWGASGVICIISGQIISSIIFFAVALLFILNGLKLGKSE